MLHNFSFLGLMNPRPRTQDKHVLLEDLQNLRNVDFSTFQEILESQWAATAKGIFEMATGIDYRRKEMVQRESRRLKEIVRRDKADVFSAAQLPLVELWIERFKKDLLEGSASSDAVRREFENLVLPWLIPYMYSKCTITDGSSLDFQTGLKDFCFIDDASVS